MHSKSDVIKAGYIHNCQDFYSIVLDTCLALTTAQANKHRHGHNLSKDMLKS